MPTLAPGHRQTGIILVGFGKLQMQRALFDPAESLLLEAYPIVADALGAEHQMTVDIVGQLAELYQSREEPERAARWRGR